MCIAAALRVVSRTLRLSLASAWQRILDIVSLHITLHAGAGRNEQQRNNATTPI